jgi:predicted glycogen debranching enzyme
VREITCAGDNADPGALRHEEWLVANGFGGYASGTVGGGVTRRYHGLLVAALPAPFGRMVMLNDVAEEVRYADGRSVRLCMSTPQDEGASCATLTLFRLEAGLPVWRYALDGAVIERRVVLPHRQNMVHITYRLLEGPALRLKLRPAVQFRPIEAPVNAAFARPYVLSVTEDRYEIAADPDLPVLRLTLKGGNVALTVAGSHRRDAIYEREAERGYESRGLLWTPGYFTVDLSCGRAVTLVASTEPWSTVLALGSDEALDFEFMRRRRLVAQAHPAAREGVAAELVLAANAFLITPAGRIADRTRAQAAGDEVRTVIAGYHWFTDWGRDTMISLEGLTLATGRHNHARWILLTFGHYLRDGLIPNLFPEGEDTGLYHTADATLWFFHALDRYLAATGDRSTVRLLLPKLRAVIDHHLRGTLFGIGVDRADGLLRQGAEGYQLTWMDAKVGDWVVTPRRGKAVEINALWYNALRLMADWLEAEDDGRGVRAMAEHAARAYEAFNRRFWYSEGGYLYDIVDGESGDDPACRPNQLFAISLGNPVLEPDRWPDVVNVARDRLLTPFGLRSLAPGDPNYKPRYYGDLRARDAAYHQGTAWAWLIGPFIDAWLKVHPDDRAGARRFLDGLVGHLGTAGIGTISEIFDAEAPFTPRGCIAQAWSVAETLRCWVKTAPDLGREPPVTRT